jgi:hypothetical protein
MYYSGKHRVGEEGLRMVILSCAVCLSLGACLGFLGAGLCATASDKPQRRLNANATPMGRGWENSKASPAIGSFFEGEKSLSSFQQVRGRCDASYETADSTD